MVKLSVELIQQAYQHINPVRDRELDLRGYKIPVIENLGATLVSAEPGSNTGQCLGATPVALGDTLVSAGRAWVPYWSAVVGTR